MGFYGRIVILSASLVPALGLILLACSESESSTRASDATDAAANPFDQCQSACEVKMWPRLIVSSALGDDAGAENWKVTGTYDDGTVWDGMPGCPVGILKFPCTFSFFAGDKNVWILLQIDTGSQLIQQKVTFGPFNHCARDIAVVYIVPNSDGTLRATDAEYISPCSAL
ncbi:MAG: hypothetical protein FWD73_03100 [Polyangiaceae bacterium]|nr:hypothetical protein [Polyangiaceae bacterium]